MAVVANGWKMVKVCVWGGGGKYGYRIMLMMYAWEKRYNTIFNPFPAMPNNCHLLFSWWGRGYEASLTNSVDSDQAIICSRLGALRVKIDRAEINTACWVILHAFVVVC